MNKVSPFEWLGCGINLVVLVAGLVGIGWIITTQHVIFGLIAFIVGFPALTFLYCGFGLPALGIIPHKDDNGDDVIEH